MAGVTAAWNSLIAGRPIMDGGQPRRDTTVVVCTRRKLP